MSAILGRIEFDGRPVDDVMFHGAAEAITPYGRDGQGILFGEDYAFAYRNHQVLRQRPAEKQPIKMAELTCVGDFIIDNREDLSSVLGLGAREAEEFSDSAMVLTAWQKLGPSCLTHIVGDFAFAIWDAAARRCHLVRDHIGARPLYWSRRGNTLIFASDIRAIEAFEEFDWPIDDHIVAHYLDNPSRPLPKTFFKDIHRVSPGGVETIDLTSTKSFSWWPFEMTQSQGKRSLEETTEDLRRITEEAVRCRIDTDLSVGTHVSGGIDSTIVTSLAASLLSSEGRKLSAGYTWAPALDSQFPHMGSGDERPVIEEISALWDFPIRFGGTNENTTRFKALKRSMAYEGTANLAEELDVLTKAKSDGVRILLSGWGGDEAFSSQGDGYLAWLIRSGKFRQAARVLRAKSGGGNTTAASRILWQSGIVPMLPDVLFDFFSPWTDLYSASCFARPELLEKARSLGVLSKDDMRLRANPTEYDLELIRRGHIAARMETWAAWGAQHGIVYRYPLTDRRLIDFILSLTPEQRFGNGRGRGLAHRAFRSLLPHQLSKLDIANEAKRRVMRQGCLALLADDGEVTSRVRGSTWIDAERYLQALNAASKDPNSAEKDRHVRLANLFGATRALFLKGA